MLLLATLYHIVLSILYGLLLPERGEEESSGVVFLPFIPILSFNHSRTIDCTTLDHPESALIAQPEGEGVEGFVLIVKFIMPRIITHSEPRIVDRQPDGEARFSGWVD